MSLMKSKFRGSLLGSLLGDCLGAPFEGDDVTSGDKIIIQRYFDKLEHPQLEAPFRPYTDDTAMMKSIGKFLIDKPEPDYKFLARLFAKEYFAEPRRGYGQNVVEVFNKLKSSKFSDVYKPASEQFNGSGSFGNGGAMRIAPVALYFHSDFDMMVEVARNSTKITHTHESGVNGAILQCIAVHQALLQDPKDKMDTQDFSERLIEKMKKIEKADDGLDDCETPYQDKLKTLLHLLGKKFDEETDDEAIFLLGNNISAYESVPTAIYCFLRAQNEIPTVNTDNLFRRTIQYAITLGGDTDTIACMAGAIAGAYLGDECINPNIIRHCEYHKEITELANNLYDAREQTPSE